MAAWRDVKQSMMKRTNGFCGSAVLQYSPTVTSGASTGLGTVAGFIDQAMTPPSAYYSDTELRNVLKMSQAEVDQLRKAEGDIAILKQAAKAPNILAGNLEAIGKVREGMPPCKRANSVPICILYNGVTPGHKHLLYDAGQYKHTSFVVLISHCTVCSTKWSDVLHIDCISRNGDKDMTIMRGP
jgi:hypothetical protein